MMSSSEPPLLISELSASLNINILIIDDKKSERTNIIRAILQASKQIFDHHEKNPYINTFYPEDHIRRKRSSMSIEHTPTEDEPIITITLLTADDGSTALPYLTSHPINTIICDVEMQTMHGDIFYQRARKENYQNPFFFRTTLKSTDPKISSAVSTGAQHILKASEDDQVPTGWKPRLYNIIQTAIANNTHKAGASAGAGTGASTESGNALFVKAPSGTPPPHAPTKVTPLPAPPEIVDTRPETPSFVTVEMKGNQSPAASKPRASTDRSSVTAEGPSNSTHPVGAKSGYCFLKCLQRLKCWGSKHPESVEASR